MKTRVTLGKLAFSLMFLSSLTSCNKDGFYQKDNLNPTAGQTAGADNGGQEGGVDAGTVGSTQGGVSSGTTGGTSGSATTGSTSGGTTGSTDGSTVGGSTTGSSTTGGTSTGSSTTGSTDGSTVGGTTTGSSTTGSTDGSTVGGATTGGSTTGSTTGGTTGITYQAVEEDFLQSNSSAKLDILWVIDDSGSMATAQDSLSSNLDSFIHNFITKNVDFKMAITTTDTSTAAKKGHMVTGSDTKLTSAKAHADPNQFMIDFANLCKVGITGSGYEKGLEGMEGFMTRFASTWMRPDANLAVVIISDEEDQSPNSPASYWSNLAANKTSAGQVKVYTIVDKTNSHAVAPGITLGHERYAAVADASGGIVGDIYANFATTLQDMGDSIINLLDSFALANSPVAGSLHVYVNNVETTDYSYDSVSRSIKFDLGHIPPVGATIKVTYLK